MVSWGEEKKKRKKTPIFNFVRRHVPGVASFRGFPRFRPGILLSPLFPRDRAAWHARLYDVKRIQGGAARESNRLRSGGRRSRGVRSLLASFQLNSIGRFKWVELAYHCRRLYEYLLRPCRGPPRSTLYPGWILKYQFRAVY